MLSSEANVILVSSGANVIIWCYHVMLSSGMITPPFLVFPGNLTHSKKDNIEIKRQNNIHRYGTEPIPTVLPLILITDYL